MKRTFTLIEVMVALVLIGILTTGLFQLFYQSLAKQREGYRYKEYTLQLSLFEQNCKTLFSRAQSVWLTNHPLSQYPALSFQFASSLDPEEEYCTLLTCTFYLNEKGELTFTESPELKKERKNLFLSGVAKVSYRFFSKKTGKWQESWSQKMEEVPSMLEITLHGKKQSTPFVFFLDPSSEPISYSL